jgi:hypothetical protein
MVLHFRIGTHGSKGIHNVHPFRINDSVYFCHNGVLKTPDHKKWSDTMVYNKMYLQNLPEHFYKNFAILQLLEENIDSSKFVFLTKDRHIIILNKKLGEEDKKTGVWYSNSSFKALRFSSKSIASYFEGDDELYNEWYGKSSQRLLSEAPTSIQPIVPSMTICHKCHMTHDLKDLYPIDDISEDVYCKECKKEVLKNLSESCMWCDKKINKDEIEIELDSGEVFCTMCSEILKEMGTLDVAA